MAWYGIAWTHQTLLMLDAEAHQKIFNESIFYETFGTFFSILSLPNNISFVYQLHIQFVIKTRK